MSIEFWIVLLLLTAGLSAWIGFTFARRGSPSQADMDALETRLDEARDHADAVQTNVNEHFEQSAVLFGRLANDYREFLDHFSASAKTLGLSENRARELLEQGLQPVLTHESGQTIDDEAVEPEATAEEAPAAAEAALAGEELVSEEEPVSEEVEEVSADLETAAVDESDDIPVLQEPLSESEPVLDIVEKAETDADSETARVADVVVDVPAANTDEDVSVNTDEDVPVNTDDEDTAVKRANP